MRFWRTAGALAIGLVLGASAVAMGVDPPSQYTGCLGKDGMLYKVALGGEPKQACSKTETQISWNEVGPEGQKGDPGAKGDPGPANLDALAGSACTVAGNSGTVSYTVDYLTGAVTLRCDHTVSVSVTNGILRIIDIRFPASDGLSCSEAATCSFTYQHGASYAAVLLTNRSPFQYDCGDGLMQQATASGDLWDGRCGFSGEGWAPFTSDHVVTVQLPS